MDDVLIFGGSERSPELRREVPVGVVDPFLYAEASGTRHVVISRMEIPRLAAAAAGVVFHPVDELGGDELGRRGLGRDEVLEQVAGRFCREQGIGRAVVPGTFR